MNKRVVITGMGAVTPIGNNVPDFWQSVRDGVVGIAPITRFDATDYRATLAAEVKDYQADERYVTKKETKRMDLFCYYAMGAAGEAVEDSGLDLEYIRGNGRVGTIIGSGIGGLISLQEQITKMNEKGGARVAPLSIPMAIGNMAAGLVSIKYGATGVCFGVVTACATGTNCIGEAFRNIAQGKSDVIIAGGTEAAIIDIGISSFDALTALSRSTDPKRASIPFDKERNGFIMGDGAGVLIVEELEHAQKRGAKIYAEIVGYGTNADAYHMTSPDPTGAGAAGAMRMAIEDAGLKPEDISYINAHGTSTPPNDIAETNAIKQVFGEHAYNIPVSSSKSMFGHMLGAAGAVESMVCIKALQEGFVPATMGLQEPEEGCDLNYVPNKGYEAELKTAITNSFGFGGHNAVLCYKKWEGK